MVDSTTTITFTKKYKLINVEGKTWRAVAGPITWLNNATLSQEMDYDDDLTPLSESVYTQLYETFQEVSQLMQEKDLPEDSLIKKMNPPDYIFVSWSYAAFMHIVSTRGSRVANEAGGGMYDFDLSSFTDADRIMVHMISMFTQDYINSKSNVARGERPPLEADWLNA